MNKRIDFTIAVVLVLLAAASRVVLFPHNFSPIIGMALFAGATFSDRRFAMALPIAAMLLSDVIFEVSGLAQGFWGVGQIVNYAALILVTVIGFQLKNRNAVKIGLFTVGSSLIFWVLSNIGFFVFENPQFGLYSNDANGLVNCFYAALPFLKNSVVADLVYSTILFGSYYLMAHFASKKQVA